MLCQWGYNGINREQKPREKESLNLGSAEMKAYIIYAQFPSLVEFLESLYVIIEAWIVTTSGSNEVSIGSRTWENLWYSKVQIGILMLNSSLCSMPFTNRHFQSCTTAQWICDMSLYPLNVFRFLRILLKWRISRRQYTGLLHKIISQLCSRVYFWSLYLV